MSKIPILLFLTIISPILLKLAQTPNDIVPDYSNPNSLITILKTYTQFKFKNTNGIFFHFNTNVIDISTRTSVGTKLNEIYRENNEHVVMFIMVSLETIQKYDSEAFKNKGEKWKNEVLDLICREFGYDKDKATLVFFPFEKDTLSAMSITTGSRAGEYITETVKKYIFENYKPKIADKDFGQLHELAGYIKDIYNQGKSKQKKDGGVGLSVGAKVGLGIGVTIAFILLALLLNYFVGPHAPCGLLTSCCDLCVDKMNRKNEI